MTSRTFGSPGSKLLIYYNIYYIIKKKKKKKKLRPKRVRNGLFLRFLCLNKLCAQRLLSKLAMVGRHCSRTWISGLVKQIALTIPQMAEMTFAAFPADVPANCGVKPDACVTILAQVTTTHHSGAKLLFMMQASL
jgi:hypothetical protein